MQSKQRILLGHGSGGRLTHDLIRTAILSKFGNPILDKLTDSAVLPYREKLAFTTDSFVVTPWKFPGGDIGKLAVCGTINDLAVQGARPEYLSVGLIIEEGLPYAVFNTIIDSMAQAARKSNVAIATGDIKVVEKGACDTIFINTSGVGRLVTRRDLSAQRIKPGDAIILTGTIAEHGLAVLASRRGLDLDLGITSDCQALDSLLVPLAGKIGGIKFMRDPTRGGLATTLHEIAESAGLGIIVEERKIPITSKVRAACELFGIEALFVANEGKAVLVADKGVSGTIVRNLRRHPFGRHAAVIGTITSGAKNHVILHTSVGTQRLIDMMDAEPLPRIC